GVAHTSAHHFREFPFPRRETQQEAHAGGSGVGPALARDLLEMDQMPRAAEGLDLEAHGLHDGAYRRSRRGRDYGLRRGAAVGGVEGPTRTQDFLGDPKHAARM